MSHVEDYFYESSKESDGSNELDMSESWVFVEYKNTDSSSNKSEEIELCEHDLGTLEADTDSDEISIISETDPRYEEDIISSSVDCHDLNQNKTPEDDTTAPTSSEDSVEQIVLVNEAKTSHRLQDDRLISLVLPETHRRFNSCMAWMIGLAVILGTGIQYFLDNSAKLNPVSVDVLQSPMTVDNDVNMLADDLELYCAHLHERDNEEFKSYNIKKCVKKLRKQYGDKRTKIVNKRLSAVSDHIEKKFENVTDKLSSVKENNTNITNEVSMDIQEIELNFKSKYRKTKDKENKHEIYSKKIKYIKKEAPVKEDEYDKVYKYVRSKSKNKHDKSWKIDQYQVEDTEKRENVAQEEINLLNKLALEQLQEIKKQRDVQQKREKELDEKEKYLRIKERELLRKEKGLKKINSEETFKEQKKHKSKFVDKIPKQQNGLGKDSKLIKNDKNERIINRSDESNEDRSDEIREQEEHTFVRELYNDSRHFIRVKDGRWFSKLFEERKNIRKKEKESEWVFDRAKNRSYKRKFRPSYIYL